MSRLWRPVLTALALLVVTVCAVQPIEPYVVYGPPYVPAVAR